MDRTEIEQQELMGMFDRLDHEVDLLWEALNNSNLDKEYREKVLRGQIENIGEVIEVMSEHIGEGEQISITTPSKIEQDNNGT